MNQESDGIERSPTELALFAITFGGFVVGAAGIVLSSAGIAICGFLGLSLALGAFGLRQFLGE
jgi:hypothetical protein